MDLSPQMFMDIPKVVGYHWKERNFNWPMMIYISLVHVVAACGLMRLTSCSYETLIWAFFLWPIRYVRTLRSGCLWLLHHYFLVTFSHLILQSFLFGFFLQWVWDNSRSSQTVVTSVI